MSKTRIAFCTVLNDEFVLGFIVLMHSIKKKHHGFDHDFVILSNDKLSHLSDESKRIIRSIYKNVIFKDVDDNVYANVWNQRDGRIQTPERLKPAFFVLDAFSLSEYDKVITLDSDMILIGSLDELIQLDCDLGASQAYNYELDETLDYFNTGVMVIGAAHLTGDTYTKLLNHQMSEGFKNSVGKADQAVLNDCLGLSAITVIDRSYNTTKRKYPDSVISDVSRLETDDVSIVHFVGEKPWQLHDSEYESNYCVLESYWRRLLKDALPYGKLLDYLCLNNYKLASTLSAEDAGARRLRERKERTRDIRRINNQLLDEIAMLSKKLSSRLKRRKQVSNWRLDIHVKRMLSGSVSDLDWAIDQIKKLRSQVIKKSKQIEKSVKSQFSDQVADSIKGLSTRPEGESTSIGAPIATKQAEAAVQSSSGTTKQAASVKNLVATDAPVVGENSDKSRIKKLKDKNVRLTRDFARLSKQLRQVEEVLVFRGNIPEMSLNAQSPIDLPDDVAIAVAVNDAFLPGLECLIHGLKKHHSDFAVPVHVFHDEGLSNESLKYLTSCYSGFRFTKVKAKDYEEIEAHKRIGHTSYYIFEAFRLSGYDQVLVLDADILCCGPIGSIFDSDVEFAAALNVGETLAPFTPQDGCNSVFNSGVMLLGQTIRNEETFRRLVTLAGEKAGSDDPAIARFADQRILNFAFKDQPIKFLDLSFNAPTKFADTYPGFDVSNVSLLHFTGIKPWAVRPKGKARSAVDILFKLWEADYRAAREINRVRYFRESGASERLMQLKGIHAGKRAFIVGNGPSLASQDLSLLKDEITFVGNWFALHEAYESIDPNYYCLCSHTIFGGWSNPNPELENNLKQLLLEKTAKAKKFFSFDYMPYLEGEDLFPGHELHYLIYEKPLKTFVDSAKHYNLDPTQPLNDGHTVITTFCMLLAHWMGIKEIYLIGCDCDYGISQESDPKKYFYPHELHTTKTSAYKHLQSVWGGDGARIFNTYEIVKDTMESEGCTIFNSTQGGKLEVFPRVEYASLFDQN